MLARELIAAPARTSSILRPGSILCSWSSTVDVIGDDGNDDCDCDDCDDDDGDALPLSRRERFDDAAIGDAAVVFNSRVHVLVRLVSFSFMSIAVVQLSALSSIDAHLLYRCFSLSAATADTNSNL